MKHSGHNQTDAEVISSYPAGVFTFSTVVLVLANLVPVAGAFFFGWDLINVLVVYWAESAVIGFYNFCKIIVIGGDFSLYYGLLFLGHFGAFMVFHFVILYNIFLDQMESGLSVSAEQAILLLTAIWPALVALFISHGVSFLVNFLGREEYRNRSARKQMHEPYQRIVFMHLVIFFSAALIAILGDSSTVLLLIIIAKIVVDARAHIKERMQIK